MILQVPPFDAQIAAIEVGKELATLVMLLSIGWPPSIIEPDLLFLITLPWWGPVLSLILIALLMVTGRIFAVIKMEKNRAFHIAA